MTNTSERLVNGKDYSRINSIQCKIYTAYQNKVKNKSNRVRQKHCSMFRFNQLNCICFDFIQGLATTTA